MRDFYRTYSNSPEVLAEAMSIGWAQNVIILEAELTLQDKLWYIRAVRRFGWSKVTLAEEIPSAAHLNIALDLEAEVCYTGENSTTECVNDDENSLCVPRQYTFCP